MDTVIVGVDASESSRNAVEFAGERAKALGLSMVVVHIIPWSPYSFSTPGENERRGGLKAIEVTAATEQIVEPLVALAEKSEISVESVVQHGDPVDMIVDIAVERSARQIFVGRTGDSRVRQAIFGSIPGHLVQVSPVPVTVVP